MATTAVTDDNFDETIQDGLVVVDFWAEWCPPCKQMAPALEDASDELAGKVAITKLNVADHPMSGAKHNVTGMPTLILFRNGHEIARHIGAMSKAKILQWVTDAQTA